MILRIYQAPRTTFAGLPDGASAFIGSHTGALPAPGTTFRRYALVWTVLEARTPGPGEWTFRLIAAPQSEVVDPQPATQP